MIRKKTGTSRENKQKLWKKLLKKKTTDSKNQKMEKEKKEDYTYMLWWK